MTITTVSVQYNGGLLPDIILLTNNVTTPLSGNPFKSLEEVSSLHPMKQQVF